MKAKSIVRRIEARVIRTSRLTRNHLFSERNRCVKPTVNRV